MTNYINPENSFIHFLAPTLCGIKPASMFTLAISEVDEKTLCLWKYRAEKQNLNLATLKYSRNRLMIVAYNIEWITKLLLEEKIQTYLYDKGYSSAGNVCKILEELFFRLENHIEFPHEVGLILGYPFEDVINFEKNEGRNCKYCGYWKSYSNPSDAKICCEQYKFCSQVCGQWFKQGLSVPEIIKKYKEAAQVAA